MLARASTSTALAVSRAACIVQAQCCLTSHMQCAWSSHAKQTAKDFQQKFADNSLPRCIESKQHKSRSGFGDFPRCHEQHTAGARSWSCGRPVPQRRQGPSALHSWPPQLQHAPPVQPPQEAAPAHGQQHSTIIQGIDITTKSAFTFCTVLFKIQCTSME